MQYHNLILKTILTKKKTRVLALSMFYETRKHPKKAFKVLSCVIYTIIGNYVCIDYSACEWKKLSEQPVDIGSYDKIFGIGIPDLLMNLMSCNIFIKNINPIVILKYPKRILEYYFSKGFNLFDCNTNNLSKLTNEVKDRIHALKIENPEKVMTKYWELEFHIC